MLEFLSDVGARIESTCAYAIYTPVLVASYVWIAVSLFKKANGDFLRLIILSCFSLPHTNFYTILAHRIKRVADQRLGESWCCIVGSNFSLNSNNTRSLGYAHYTDVSLCLLANFFYRWPETTGGFLHAAVYSKLQKYERKLVLAFYLLNHLTYGMFLVVLFMSFNIFCALVYRRMFVCFPFWNHCFYKYVLAFLIVPVFFFLEMLSESAESRFRYVPAEDQYHLVSRSMVPQYVKRETGTTILGVLWAITMILLTSTLIRLFCRICFKHAKRVDMDELRNAIICLLYTALRGMFLGYEVLTCGYQASGDADSVHRLGGLFPLMNDVITLSPPLFLLAASVQIRRAVLPARFSRKRHTIGDLEGEGGMPVDPNGTNKIVPSAADPPVQMSDLGVHVKEEKKEDEKAVEKGKAEEQETSLSRPASVLSDSIFSEGAPAYCDINDHPALPYGLDWTDHLSSKKLDELGQAAKSKKADDTKAPPADKPVKPPVEEVAPDEDEPTPAAEEPQAEAKGESKKEKKKRLKKEHEELEKEMRQVDETGSQIELITPEDPDGPYHFQRKEGEEP